MKDLESQNFEKSWRDAFVGAELAPSESVWDEIDLSISQAQTIAMRKRVIFYQRLAAAAVIFGLSLGIAGMWYWNNSNENFLVVAEYNLPSAQQNKVEQTPLARTENQASDLKSDENVELQNGDDLPTNSEWKSDRSLKKSNESNWVPQSFVESERANSSTTFLNIDDTKEVIQREIHIESDYVVTALAASNQLPTVEPVIRERIQTQLMPAKKWKENELLENEKSKNVDIKDNWWASLNGSGGSYNQPTTNNTTMAYSSLRSHNPGLTSTPASSQASIGVSYSYGMAVGKRIAPKWILMSGVSYLNQSIGYTSNILVVDASNQAKAFVADLASQSTNITSTSPYNISSINEFVSIPVQAGYLLLNRNAGIQLNAGIAADIFYRNTLADKTGKIASYTQEAGDNSAYRTLNWTGLFATEFSYKLTKHYQIAVLPGVRYSFNSSLTSNSGAVTNPLNWDVGFRLKYVFRN